MCLQIRENLIEKEDGFEYRHDVSIYPDGNWILRNDLFVDIDYDVTSFSLAHHLIKI
jgi:hypothetical protein